MSMSDAPAGTPPPLTPSQQILRFFAFDHLPAPLREISGYCSYAAHEMERMLPDGPEKTMGLRKLLEAKDCFVRAALPPAPAYPLLDPPADTSWQRNGEGTA